MLWAFGRFYSKSAKAIEDVEEGAWGLAFSKHQEQHVGEKDNFIHF